MKNNVGKDMFDWIFDKLGYVRKANLGGVAISTNAQFELDYIAEKTGLKAHRVAPEHNFNGFLKIAGHPDAQKVESLLFKYSKDGYVFTPDSLLLFGNICTITTKADRVEFRRSQINLVT